VFFDKIVRPSMYRLGKNDPEVVHERTLMALSRINAVSPALRALHAYYGTEAPTTVLGLRFPNPVGLAAGMDKNGLALHAWPALGFGFVEVGTVTGLAQPGNPKPRLFTLSDSTAVINRMGFNNAGAGALAERLATSGKPGVPLGISIGKSKAAALEDVAADYRISLRALHPHADYFAINVSSPNTPGLRALQDRPALTELLSDLRATSRTLAAEAGKEPTPLLVKVAPDLTDDALAELLEVCTAHDVAGVIATNTTLARDGLAASDRRAGEETGGLSGRPLTGRALEVVRFIHARTEGKLPIIGVGGILGPDDARRMLDAGASLVQLYTGFALSGPGLVRRITRGLAAPR
jgi:dihydroorotate dehydrogenase